MYIYRLFKFKFVLFLLLMSVQTILNAQTVTICADNMKFADAVQALYNNNTGTSNNPNLWTLSSTVLNVDNNGTPGNKSDDIIRGFNIGSQLLNFQYNGGAFHHITVVRNSSPNLSYTLSASSTCASSNPVISLSGSETGINYQLRRNGGNVGSVVAGTGSAISFPSVSLSGVYSVEAQSGCGNNLISSTIAITSGINTSYTLNSSNNCAKNNPTITLSGSETGVTYKLYRDNILVSGSSKNGTGSSISFNPVSQGGEYSVKASNSCGTSDINSKVYIYPNVNIGYALNASSQCASDNPAITLIGSDIGIEYQLFKGSSSIGGKIPGSGSSITFPTVSSGGTYTVKAFSPCESTGISLTSNVVINDAPINHGLNEATVCTSDAFTIKMKGSTSGVKYDLKSDMGTIVQTLTGDGSNIEFSKPANAGVYTVVASKGTCSLLQSGKVTVIEAPVDIPLNNQGIFCPDNPITMGSASNPTSRNVTYTLYRDGVTQVKDLPGNDGELSFGTVSNVGVYTVRASSGSCTALMTGQITIVEQPKTLNLTANKTSYCDEGQSGVTLTLDGVGGMHPENQIRYYLYTSDDGVNFVSGGVDAFQYGNGTDPITWKNVKTNAGHNDVYFKVIARSNGDKVCEVPMSGVIHVSKVLPPTATITNISPTNKCAGGAEEVKLTLDFTGNPPFNFIVEDNSGNESPVITSNNYTYVFYPKNYATLGEPTISTTYHLKEVTDASSCNPVDGGVANISINPAPELTFTPVAPEVCFGESVTISVTGAGAGGSYVWSSGSGGTLISDNISVSPPSDETFSVRATSANGCVSNKSVVVKVNQLPDVAIQWPAGETDHELCKNATPITLAEAHGLSGGDFSIDDTPIGTTIFDPSKFDVGEHKLTYTYTDDKGCTNKVDDKIIVNKLPEIVFVDLKDYYCADEGEVTYRAIPDGSQPGTTGNYSIVGHLEASANNWRWVDANHVAHLDITNALNAIGPGQLDVKFDFTDANGCYNQIIKTTELRPDYRKELSIVDLPAKMCQDDAPVEITGYLSGTPLAVTPPAHMDFRGPGVEDADNTDNKAMFNPKVAGPGIHTIVIDYTDELGCSGSASATVQVGTPITLVDFKTEYCESDVTAYPLRGFIERVAPTTTQKSYFDIIDKDDNIIQSNIPNWGTPYQFIPHNLGKGMFKVVYKYTDEAGCNNELVTPVFIIEELDATFTIDGKDFVNAQSTFCSNDSPVALEGSSNLINYVKYDPLVATDVVSSSFIGNGTTGNGLFGGSFNPGADNIQTQPSGTTVLNTITHNVTHTINGKSCSTTAEFNISVPRVDVGISNLKDNYCNTDAISVITVNGADGSKGTAKFKATKNSATSPFLVDNGDNTATINPAIGAGTYVVTMEFTKTVDGCIKIISKEVTVHNNEPVTFSGVTNNQKICRSSNPIPLFGDIISPDPSKVNGVFTIAPAVTDGIVNDGTVNSVTIVDGDGKAYLIPQKLPVSIYTITYSYTNEAGCLAEYTKTIEIVDGPSATFNVIPKDKNGNQESAYCIGEAGVKVGLSGSSTGVTYELYKGGSPLSPVVEFVGNGSKFYFTDNGNATGTEKIFDTGVYTVLAKLNGCESLMAEQVVVKQYELLLELDNKKDMSCHNTDDGEITIKCSGGSGNYEFQINDGTTTSAWQSSPTFKGLGQGTYSFNVKDLSSAACEKVDALVDIKILNPDPIVIVEDASIRIPVGCGGCVPDVSCEGSATISATGGVLNPGDNYIVNWSTGGNKFTETGMPTGDASVTVTDSEGCSSTATITIEQNPQLTLVEDPNTAVHIDNICNGGSSGEFIVIAGGGSYESTVMPAGYPKYGYEFSLIDPASATETPVWSAGNIPGNPKLFKVSNVKAGTYNVWVRDANPLYKNRCYWQVSTPIVITEPSPVSVVVESFKPITCNGAAEGEIVVRATGGLSNTYQFSTIDPAVSSDPSIWHDYNFGTVGNSYRIQNLVSGSYTIWVRDKANPSCAIANVSQVIDPVDILDYRLIKQQNVSCKSGNDGYLEILAQGGGGNYVYQWIDVNGVLGTVGAVISSSNIAQNLKAGDYKLILSDPNGTCTGSTITKTFNITEPANALSVTNVIKDNDCSAVSTGAITINITGGSAPYSINWNNGVTDKLKNENLTPGNYSVSVRDANGCEFDNSTTPYIVGELPNITLLNSVVNNISCFGDNSGSIEVEVTGGSGKYRFKIGTNSWVAPVPVNSNKYIFNNLNAGDYEIFVSDANNNACEYSLGTFKIIEPDKLTLTYNLTGGVGNISCNGANDGFITVSASGGSVNASGVRSYDYSLDNGATWINNQLATYTFSSLSAGSYYIKVRDNNNPTCVCDNVLTIKLTQPEAVKVSVVKVEKASCFGSGDAKVTLTAQGGSGNYVYKCVETGNWQDSPVITLVDGTFTFVAKDRDVAGCVSLPTAPVNLVSPKDFNCIVTKTDISCFGANDGKLSFDTKYVSGSSDVFQYSIDNGSSWQEADFTNLPAGNYNVRVRPKYSPACEKILPNTYSIAEPAKLNVVSNSITDVTCYQGNNGAIQLNVTGGTNPYTYQWAGISDADGGKTNNVSNLSVGNYTVSVKDANGCVATHNQEIKQSDKIEVTTDLQHVVIGGTSTGVITITNITGGPTSNYTVDWADDAAYHGTKRENIPAGIYEFTISSNDASNVVLCSKSFKVEIKDQNAPLNFTLTSKSAECFGNDGKLDVNIKSGNPPYKISWFQGISLIGNTTTSNMVYSVLVKSGNYRVEIEDASGAVLSKSIWVDQPKDFSITALINKDKVCYDDKANLEITINGDAWNDPLLKNKFKITWRDPDGFIAQDGDFSTNNTLINQTKSGIYTARVWNSDYPTCTKEASFNISDPAPIGINIVEIKNVTCFNGNNGSITIEPTGRPSTHSYSFKWEYRQDDTQPWAVITGSAKQIINLKSGQYRVTVKSLSGGCEFVSDPLVIKQAEKIEFNTNYTNVETCGGDNSGNIQLFNIRGGTAPYKYYINSVANNIPLSDASVTINDLVKGDYTIKISDVNSCWSDETRIIIDEPELLAINNVVSTIDCDGTNGKIVFDIDGGTVDALGGHKYNVVVSPDGKADINLGVVTNQHVDHTSLENLSPNHYVIKVRDLLSKDINQCVKTADVTLEPITITGTVVNPTCPGVSNGRIENVIVSGASPGYVYAWTSSTGGAGIINSQLSQDGLSDGKFTLTVTDPGRGNCVISKEFILDYEHVIDVTSSISDVKCNGENNGSVTIQNVNGLGINTSYTWSGGADGTYSSHSQDISNLKAGVYALELSTVHDGNVCKYINNFTVAEPDPIDFNVAYSVTKCEPYKRLITVSPVSGGVGQRTYLWTGTAVDASYPGYPSSVEITKGGTYTVTIKDKNNCTLSKSVIVPDSVTINSTVNHVSCYGGNNGSISIDDIMGGSQVFSFNWTGVDVNGNTIVLPNPNNRNIDKLIAGTYSLAITDQNMQDAGGKCTTNYTFVVNQPLDINISASVTRVSCYNEKDGAIEIGINGGNMPYNYAWNSVPAGNNYFDKNQYNLSTGDYTLTVTDAKGCIKKTTVNVPQDDKITISSSVTDTSCDGSNGAIDITVAGGSGSGFSYMWSTADGSGLNVTNEDQTGLTGGVYTVVATDNGPGRTCSATETFVLTNKLEIVNTNITKVSCKGNDDGAISYDVIGGSGSYKFEWTTISGDATHVDINSQNQTGLSEGEYKVKITDTRIDPLGVDCYIEKTFIVTSNTALDVTVAEFESNICYGAATGGLQATVVGGSGNYEYRWNDVVGSNKLNNITQGTYNLKVTDTSLGCTFVGSYTIDGPAAPLTIDNIDITNVLCRDDASGEINVTVSGGTPNLGANKYEYQWSGPSAATGANPKNLLAGIYNLKVVDANGCEVDSANIVITQPDSRITVTNPVIVDVTTPDPGQNDGQITVDVTGGTPGYVYAWTNSSDGTNAPGTGNNPRTLLTAGTYDLTVTDNNGCAASIKKMHVAKPSEALGFESVVHQISPCNGANNGKIIITRVFGGYPIGGNNYHIVVSGASSVDVYGTDLTLDNLAPGDYIISVTDAASTPVTYSKTIKISQPDVLTMNTAVVKNVDCFEQYAGTIDVTVNGGIPNASNEYRVELRSDEGYFKSVNNVKQAVAYSFTNLPAGNYTITAFDFASEVDNAIPNRGNCSVSDTKLITQPAAVVDLSPVDTDLNICKGEEFKMAVTTSNWDFASQGSFKVEVYDGFNIQEYTVNKSPFEIIVTPQTSRTYKLGKVYDITDPNCKKGKAMNSVISLIVHELPTAAISGVSEVCQDGKANLTVQLTGVKPYSVTWVDENNTKSDTKTGINSGTFDFEDTPVADAKYKVTKVTDAYCSNVGTGEVDVKVNDKPVITLSGATDICEGTSANLQINVSKGIAPVVVNYNANGASGTLVINDITIPYTWTVSPVVTTVYEITSVVDAKGCEMDVNASLQATVNVNPLVKSIDKINSIADKGSVCQGSKGIDYFVSAVANSTQYIWEADPGISIMSGDGTTNITVDIARNFMGGYIRVYPKNDCGNGAKVERWINSNPLPDEIITKPVGPDKLCEGATGIIYSIPASNNAARYEWSVPAGLIIDGDATGTSIVVHNDPLVPSTVGEIKVRPVNDCSNDEPWSPSLTVSITPMPQPYAGDDKRICSTVYTLKADALNAGEKGEWEIVSGSGQFNNVADKNNPTCDVNNLSQGENKFIWKVTNIASNCSKSDEVIITNDMLTVEAVASDDIVCDGKVKLTGTALSDLVAPDDAVWSTTGGATIISGSNNVTNITDMDRGENIFYWTVRKGSCYSKSKPVKVVNNQPTEALIDNVAGITITRIDVPCGDNNLTLKAHNLPEPDENGYWETKEGALNIDDVYSPTINISDIAYGDHVLSWNIRKGDCVSSAKVVISMNMHPIKVKDGEDVCSETYELVGNEPTKGATAAWKVIKGNASLLNADQYNAQASGLSKENNGENVFRYTITRNGCSNYKDVTIYNKMPSKAKIVGDAVTQTICDYETVLEAETPTYGTGYWSVIKGYDNNVFENVDKPKTKVTNIEHGESIYRWTVSTDKCSDYIDVTITNNHVDVYAGRDTAVCQPKVRLNATPAPSGTVGSWSLKGDVSSSGIWKPDANSPKAEVSGLAHGENVFVWSVNKNGCVSSDEVIVVNNQPYPVIVTNDEIYTPSDQVMLSATRPVVGSGHWEKAEGGGRILHPEKEETRVIDLMPNFNVFNWIVKNQSCTEVKKVRVQSGLLSDPDAGVDQLHLCQDSTIMTAKELPGTWGEWSRVKGHASFEDINDPHTKVTGLDKGENILRWTLHFAGSTSAFKYDDVRIVNNQPSDAYAGNNYQVCSDSTQLNGRAPSIGSIKWKFIKGGGDFEGGDNTNIKAKIYNLSQGDNELILELNNDICYSRDTITITNTKPSKAFAGDKIQVTCADSAQIKPIIPKYGIGKWVILQGSATQKDGSPITNLTSGYIYNLSQGENKFIWEVQVPGAGSDCISRDTITIISNKPSDAFAGKSRIVCDSIFELSGSNLLSGEVGTWKLMSGKGSILNPNNNVTKVEGLGRGDNIFRWKIDKNGCSTESYITLTNNYIQSVAGHDIPEICADTVVLHGNTANPGIGTWSALGGSGLVTFDDVHNSDVIVRNLDPGENILQWSIDNQGCISNSQVKVVNNLPVNVKAGFNQPSCVDSCVLSAAKPTRGVGVWSKIAGGENVDIVDKTDPATKVNKLGFGPNIFRWTVQYKGCTLTDDVQIDYNRIQANVGLKEQTHCSDKATLTANSPLPGVGTWTVAGSTSQGTFVNENDPTTEVRNLGKGKNVLRWTIEYKGCVTYDETVITNNLPSVANAGNTQLLCKDETTLDAVAPEIGIGNWEILNGKGYIPDSQKSNPKAKITKLAKGENIIRWTVTGDNGCSLTNDVKIVNNKPSKAEAGDSYAVCENQADLKANIPDYGTGMWSIADGAGQFEDETSAVTKITKLKPGKNKLRWIISAGTCADTSTIVITNNTPTIANAGSTIEDCIDYATLDANTPIIGTGKWHKVSGNMEWEDRTDPKTKVTKLANGKNIMMWVITQGNCTSTDTISVFNNVPDKSFAGDKRETCEDYLTLNANEPSFGTGTWSVVSGGGKIEFSDIHDPKAVITKLGLGQNQLRWTINYGRCATSSEVDVFSYKTSPNAGSDDITYEPEYMLNAANPGKLKGKWRVVAGKGTFVDAGYFNTVVKGLEEGVNTFRWEMEVNGCKTYDDVSIEYRLVPNAVFKTNVSKGCYPLTVEFANHSVGGSKFIWNFGDGSDELDVNVKKVTHTFNEPGRFTVTLTSPGPDGKNGVYTKEIEVFDHPKADFNFSPKTVYLPGEELTCFGFGEDMKYMWDFGDGTTSKEQNPKHEYKDVGVYTLTYELQDKNNCVDKKVVVDAVTVKQEGFIKFPTAFTPNVGNAQAVNDLNGDVNVVFKPVYRDVAEYKLQVYNRWGQLIYESEDIEEGWNGLFNNKLVIEGVYVWKAKGRFESGKQFNKAGSVTLIR